MKKKKKRGNLALTSVEHEDCIHIHISSENISREESENILKGEKDK